MFFHDMILSLQPFLFFLYTFIWAIGIDSVGDLSDLQPTRGFLYLLQFWEHPVWGNSEYGVAPMVAHDATWSRPEGALYLDISFVLGFWWCGLSLAANLAYFVAAPLGDLRTARLWYDPVLALALFYPGVWLVCPYSRRFSWHQVGSMAGAAIADFETAPPPRWLQQLKT